MTCLFIVLLLLPQLLLFLGGLLTLHHAVLFPLFDCCCCCYTRTSCLYVPALVLALYALVYPDYYIAHLLICSLFLPYHLFPLPCWLLLMTVSHYLFCIDVVWLVLL